MKASIRDGPRVRRRTSGSIAASRSQVLPEIDHQCQTLQNAHRRGRSTELVSVQEDLVKVVPEALRVQGHTLIR